MCLDLDKTQNVGTKEATKHVQMVGRANCQPHGESCSVTIKAGGGKQLTPSKHHLCRTHENQA